ncbi:hypothetical protein ACFXA3_00420 [Streptomyces sp. NPDC059456]
MTDQPTPQPADCQCTPATVIEGPLTCDPCLTASDERTDGSDR